MPGVVLAQAPLDDVAIATRLLQHDLWSAADRADADARAAATTVPAALDAPRLALRREQGFGEGGLATTVAGLEVDFELSGRAGLERDAGSALGLAIDAERRAERLDGICAARALAVEARAANERAAVEHETHAILMGLAAEVERLVAGRERAAFDAERVALRVSLHAQRARLAQADGDAARGRLAGWIGPIEGPLAVEPAQPADAAEWAERAAAEHPALAALRHRADASNQRRTVGERWWVPGVGVYGAWRQDAPDQGEVGNGYEAGLTVDLPLVDRGAPQRADADAESSRLAAAAAQRAALIRAEVAATLAALTALGPPAEADAASAPDLAERALQRYRGGVAPLAELLDAVDAVEAARIAAVDLTARRRMLRLRLACAAGAFPEPALGRLLEEGTR